MTVMTKEQEWLKGALSDGFEAYIGEVDAFHHYARNREAAADAMDEANRKANEEAQRVANLLTRDIAYRAEEERRASARIDLGDGNFATLEDIVMPPTAEWLAQNAGRTMAVAARPDQWTDRPAETVRRRYEGDQLITLYGRGVIDDDLFKVCRWYRDRREAAQMDPSPRAMQYGETVRGDPVYGHLPTTEWSAEARNDFRWATKFIPPSLLPPFQCVVISNRSFEETGKQIRRGHRYVKAAFLQAAHHLADGISHRLMFNVCS
jgi:hypothetical protein